MSLPTNKPSAQAIQVTIEEVNRVLEVERLLLSVLTEEEIVEFQRVLNDSPDVTEIGYAGVTRCGIQI